MQGAYGINEELLDQTLAKHLFETLEPFSFQCLVSTGDRVVLSQV